MGKTSKSGLGVGTGSSPQGSLSQGNVDSKVKELTKKLKPFDSTLFSYQESIPKYDGYLLNLDHSIGGSKAKFLKEALGYKTGDGFKLHMAIGQAINGKIPSKVETTPFGTKYNFNAKLKGNDGKYHSANVTIVVQNDNEKTTWRIITLTPGKKTDRRTL